MHTLRVIILFGFSGVVGFLVDAGVLYLLKGLLGLYGGRLVSFLAAVLATWLINRNMTFKDRASGLSKQGEFARYLGLMIGGGLVNYGVYALLVSRIDQVHAWPVLGVAAGSLAGMTVNLLSSRLLLYRFAGGAQADPTSSSTDS